MVIGIIAILIGLLLPSLSRAQRQSRAAACKQQMQDIGAAFQTYLNDNNGRFPPAPNLPGAIPGVSGSITDYLGKYTGNSTAVYHCPADDQLYGRIGISYFYNSELGTCRLQDSTFYQQFHSSSWVPLLWDAGNFHGGQLPYNWLFADGPIESIFQQHYAADDEWKLTDLVGRAAGFPMPRLRQNCPASWLE